MAEFKKLADVEIVTEPAEAANILIEENGIIKKAPKTVIGGSSSSIVVNCKYNSDRPDDPVYESPVFDFNEVKTALMNGADAVLRAEDVFDDCGDIKIFYLDTVRSYSIGFQSLDNKSAILNDDNTFTMLI